MLNAMTVDLEDWAQAVLGPGHPITPHVNDNVRRVLDLLDKAGVKATFFALGKVCEACPSLLPAVADAGHEIASHGYGHELLYHLTPARFEQDVRRSIELIEAQTGRRPTGYRAPAFSITEKTRWALPILASLGFRYSSSVFPIRGRRYGLPQAPREPFRWPGCDLIECPMTTFRLFGRTWPACGGGYTRLWPGRVMEWAIAQRNARNAPAVVYLHPYELAPGEVRSFRRMGVPVTRRKALTQELFRARVPDRLRRLFATFRFGTLSDALAETAALRAPVAADEPAPYGHDRWAPQALSP